MYRYTYISIYYIYFIYLYIIYISIVGKHKITGYTTEGIIVLGSDFCDSSDYNRSTEYSYEIIWSWIKVTI